MKTRVIQDEPKSTEPAPTVPKTGQDAASAAKTELRIAEQNAPEVKP
jgi:hypothetical protein